MAKVLDTFVISHKKEGDKNFLTIEPASKCEYPAKTIEISDEQWDALQYHFVKAINDMEGITKLVYVK